MTRRLDLLFGLPFRFAAVIAVLLAAVLAIGLVDCEAPEFPPPNIIKHSRILAIKTEPREVAPGDLVTITGIAVNDDGTPYIGPVAWIVTGSLDLSAGQSAGLGDLPSGEYYLQGPGFPPFTFAMPEGADFEQKFGPFPADGTILTVGMAVGDIENDPIIGFKTLVVVPNPSKQNPVYKQIIILKNGEPVAPDEDGVYQVGNAQSLKLIADVDFPTGDKKTFHWYTRTEGIQKYNVEKATEWRLPKKAGQYDLYGVARENTHTNFQEGDYEIQSSGIDWKHAVIEIK